MIVGTILRILLVCLLVGLVMAVFGITPQHMVDDTFRTLESIWLTVTRIVLWAVPYVLLGATIVLPVVAIMLILRLVRR